MKKTKELSAVIFIGLAAAIFSSCNSSSNHNVSEATAKTSKQDSMQKVLARGEYLVVHVAACLHCHSRRDFSKYAGPTIPGTEGEGGERFDNTIAADIPGIIYARNITPDSATGIGTWTDAEILRAITQGIRKNGDTLFPLMPYASFNRMAKNDLLSIIAYIRTLKPIKNQVPERHLMIPISLAYPAAALRKSVDENIAPPQSDSIKYGGYLVEMAGCSGCHTPYIRGEEDLSRMMGGGNLFNLGSFKVTSANLTPDSATGIGARGEMAFLEKFYVCRQETGYNFNPGKLNTVMPVVSFAGMTDGDLKAIYVYLRSLKPVRNAVVKYPE